MSTKRKTSGGSLVVVEVGDQQLKLVQAKGSGGSTKISRLHVQEFEKLTASLVNDFSALFKKFGLGKSRVIASLPRQAVNVRILEVPSTDPDEIADMVELQIGKQTPYSRDEIVAEHRTLGAGREGYTKILLVIVQRGLMNQRFRLLEEAGLEVESMSVSSEGLLNWYRSAGSSTKAPSTTAVADVDTSHTEFAVFAKGELVFTRNISVGASHLGDDPEKWQDKLAQEVGQSLEIYKGEAHGSPAPGQLLVTGAGAHARFKKLHGMLGDRSGLTVEAVSATHGFTKGAGAGNKGEDGVKNASFAALLGIASGPDSLEFHMVPETVDMRRRLKAKAKNLTSSGTLVMLVAALASVLSLGSLQKQVMYLTGLRSEVEEKSARAREVEKMQQTSRMIAARLDNSRAPLTIVTEMRRLTPREVVWESLVIDADKEEVTLKARATEYPILDKLRGSMDGSKVMPENVEVKDQKTDPDGKMISFTLVATESVEEK